MEPLNLPAVALGTALAFAFGMILYHPKALGRVWMEGSGVDPDGPMPVAAFALQIAALLALALVVGVTARTSALGTALLAILAASLFVAANGAFLRRSAGAIAIDAGYVLGGGALMILAQGLL